MTHEEMQAEIARLTGENARLAVLAKSKATKQRITLKVAPKTGALMVLGLNRFPVTLYREQWEVIMGMSAEIKAFITAHASELKVRGDE